MILNSMAIILDHSSTVYTEINHNCHVLVKKSKKLDFYYYCKSTKFGCDKIWWIYNFWVILEGFPYINLFKFSLPAISAKLNRTPNLVDLQYLFLKGTLRKFLAPSKIIADGWRNFWHDTESSLWRVLICQCS